MTVLSRPNGPGRRIVGSNYLEMLFFTSPLTTAGPKNIAHRTAFHSLLPHQPASRPQAERTEDRVPDPKSEVGAGLETGEETVPAEGRDQK